MIIILNLIQYVSWGLSLYILVVLAAAVVSWVRPDPRNPIVQFLYRVTEPALGLIRRLVPTIFGGLDLAPMILIFAIVLVQEVVLGGLAVLISGAPPVLILARLVMFVKSLLSLYMWIVIAAAVVSWISADLYNPIVRALYAMTEPVLGRVRRMLPMNLGGIDLSPLVVIALILLIQHVVLDGLVGLMMGRAVPMWGMGVRP